MKRLWYGGSASAPRLRLETLERCGGAQQIIQTQLDDEMAHLTPDQQDAAAAVLRFLVTTTGMKIALSTSDLADMSGRSATE